MSCTQVARCGWCWRWRACATASASSWAAPTRSTTRAPPWRACAPCAPSSRRAAARMVAAVLPHGHHEASRQLGVDAPSASAGWCTCVAPNEFRLHVASLAGVQGARHLRPGADGEWRGHLRLACSVLALPSDEDCWRGAFLSTCMPGCAGSGPGARDTAQQRDCWRNGGHCLIGACTISPWALRSHAIPAFATLSINVLICGGQVHRIPAMCILGWLILDHFEKC